ncbi:hypothetical protein [Halovivax limisalsi]|uniref:hypothetical protein n=1 Tax=Halovivax limisalsi TaxID=1453760 RepID=UPI001FFDDC58|nr:hypothetical protein [Halovivax limisalsi]
MSDASPPERASADPETGGAESPAPTIEDLFAGLSDLADDATGSTARDELGDIERLLVEAHDRGLIDSRERELRLRDVAEAFVGSVIFAAPLLVEDGVFDIADHLFASTVHGIPVFLLANTLFVVLMTYALVEWTGRNTIETVVPFGIVPLRVVMTLAVSFLVAVVLMTVWGRVGGWTSPMEAVARINVIWTVGSLGAALGDILADGADSRAPIASGEAAENRLPGLSPIDVPSGDDWRDPLHQISDGELLDALHREFADLESVFGDAADRRDADRLRERTIRAAFDDASDDTIQKYTSRDVAEAFVGSIFFSIPLLVEDGVYDVADFFLSFRVGFVPIYLLVNAVFVLLMILALVYWAGPQDVRISRPIFGVVPRRLVGIALVSFLTAAALTTMWGRVAHWDDPVVALARISVVWTVASFGAALGDILPGESSGADINDELEALGDAARDRAAAPDSRDS